VKAEKLTEEHILKWLETINITGMDTEVQSHQIQEKWQKIPFAAW
jgi:hypothetical protein